MFDDKDYSNELPSGPTLEQLAGTGHGPPSGGNVPATGIASAPGGGTIDVAFVGKSTEALGTVSDGGEAGDGRENDLDMDAVTGTGAGAGTGELDTGCRRPELGHALRQFPAQSTRLEIIHPPPVLRQGNPSGLHFLFGGFPLE